jgi:D-aminoacyl-tRNA deacylase
MRAVVQRVVNASVCVDGNLISSIGRGVCVLIGICRDDTSKDADYIVRKILNLRLFDDETTGKGWSKSVTNRTFEILCISQFTLHAVLKGNKLDFHHSMAADQSQQFYEQFIEKLRKAYRPDLIKDGQFGAYMNVSINNDGPVTITLDSRSKDLDNDVDGRSGKTTRKNAANGSTEVEKVSGGESTSKETEEEEKDRETEKKEH